MTCPQQVALVPDLWGATHAARLVCQTRLFTSIDNAPSTSIPNFHQVATSPASAPSRNGVFKHLWRLRFRNLRQPLLRRQFSVLHFPPDSPSCLWRGWATCSPPDNTVNNWWERGHEVSVSTEYRVGCEKDIRLLRQIASRRRVCPPPNPIPSSSTPFPDASLHPAYRNPAAHHILFPRQLAFLPAQSWCWRGHESWSGFLYRVTAMIKSMGRTFYNPFCYH